jgi:hypothetical protein
MLRTSRPPRLVLLAAGILFPAGGAAAGELILIPTADRPAAPTVQYRHRVSGTDEGFGSLDLPVGLDFELMLRYYNQLDRKTAIEGGGQLQVLPDGIVTPGIAVGAWDVTNSSPYGRRFFFVLTKSLGAEPFRLPKPLERAQVTFGAGTGRLGGVLAGLRLDFSSGISLVGEFDARRLNAGIWFTPLPPLTFKAELHNSNPYLGIQIRAPL